MNFEESVRYLLSLGRELAAPTQASAAKFNLENINILNEALGRPDRGYPSAHIAGTNGKGSTAAFLESILRHAGFKTGLYTSPHLERINERLRVNGDEISNAAFAETLTRLQATIEALLRDEKLRAHPTFFECVTAMAFEYFRDVGVTFGVFEVGLGGRLDATNILLPKVSVITRIDFDHENFLGHSLREIAGEKAGIIKPDVPVVVAEQSDEALLVIEERARKQGSVVTRVDEAYETTQLHFEDGCVRAHVTERSTGKSFRIAPLLPGRFQLQNALNALAAARRLATEHIHISDQAIVEGIATAQWPGRLEKLHAHPDIYLDGAHNPAAARELADFIEHNLRGRTIYMLFGALRDKAVDEVAGILFPNAGEVVFTEARTSRAISAAELARIAGYHTEAFSVETSAEDALERLMAKAGHDDVIFVTGSLYLVGQIRHYWRKRAKVAR